MEENLRLERQAQERAWQVVRECEARLELLARRAEDVSRRLGVRRAPPAMALPPPARGAASGLIEAYSAALTEQALRWEEEIRRVEAAHEAALLLSRIERNQKPGLGTVAGQAQDVFQEGSLTSSGQSHVRQARASTLLGRLSGWVDEANRKDLLTLADEFVHADQVGRAEGLEVELALRIQRANQHAERQLADARQAASLLARLRGLDGSDVSDLRIELEAVERRERLLARNAEQRTALVEAVARKQADRTYVTEVVAEELRRLGYVVEEGFATLFVEGGTAEITKPQLKEYSVRVGVEPNMGRLDVRLVRAGGTDEVAAGGRRLRDREMEEAWCHDFAELLAAMRRRRIANRVVERVRPGVEPVPAVAPAKAEVGRRASRKPAALARRF